MTFIVRLLLVAFVFILFVHFYKKAAGTLSIKKLNVTNICFYYLLVYCVIGGSVIFLGFRNHYLVQKVSDENVFTQGYVMIAYGVISLPIFQILFNKLMGIRSYRKFYENYVEKPVIIKKGKDNSAFQIVCILSLIGFLSSIYTFYCIGYVGLFEILRGNLSVMTQRVAITRDFSGNQYIRNILALGMVPILSYIAYIYMRKTRQRSWTYLFICLFLLSILLKTYNFEKAPVIIYVVFFYIIETIMGGVKKFGKAVKYGLFGIAALLYMYYALFDYEGSLFTFSSGPISRLFITQVATFFLHVQLFPKNHPFLNGSSFPSAVSWIFDTTESGIRSGRVVMENYNRAAVLSGTAGVMNSMYVAEAYANFGWIGVIISPIIVAFFTAVVPNIILYQEKDPLNISLYVFVVSVYSSAIVGGFTDFIYNALLIIIVFLFVVIRTVLNNGKIKLRLRPDYNYETHIMNELLERKGT